MRSLALLISLLLFAACTSSPRTTQTAATQTVAASLIGHEGDGSPLTTCNR
jgi:uncharacterized lipoprotein YajG